MITCFKVILNVEKYPARFYSSDVALTLQSNFSVFVFITVPKIYCKWVSISSPKFGETNCLRFGLIIGSLILFQYIPDSAMTKNVCLQLCV